MAKHQRSVSVTAQQREELDALLRRPSTAAGLAKRARASVLLAEGATVSATGRTVQMQRRHLYKWIDRFRPQGVAGLLDGQRTGRPPVFSPRSGDSLGQDCLRTAGGGGTFAVALGLCGVGSPTDRRPGGGGDAVAA